MKTRNFLKKNIKDINLRNTDSAVEEINNNNNLLANPEPTPFGNIAHDINMYTAANMVELLADVRADFTIELGKVTSDLTKKIADVVLNGNLSDLTEKHNNDISAVYDCIDTSISNLTDNLDNISNEFNNKIDTSIDELNEKIENIQKDILHNYRLTSDYTAFETWLLASSISAGSEITTDYGSVFQVKENIPAGDTQMILLWTYKEISSITNIAIDWGDGSPIENLDDIVSTNGVGNGLSAEVPKNVDISSDIGTEQEYVTVSALNDAFIAMFPDSINHSGSFKECFNLVKDFNWGDSGDASLFVVAHKYEEYDNKKYIIKIYGSDYCAINTGNVYNLYYTKDSPTTRVKSFIYEKGSTSAKRLSRCFDYDLPIASTVTSINGFTGSVNQCLFEVNVPQLYNWKNVTDIAGLFKSKNNLQKVTGRGIENIFASTSKMIAAKGFFHSCPNLKITNIRLPVFIGSGQSLRDFNEFDGGAYQSVEFNIIDVLPKEKFVDKEISVGKLFTNCYNVSCSNPTKLAQYFWEDKTIKWTNTSEAFKGACPAVISAVPPSWGGFNLDNYIPSNVPEDKQPLSEHYFNTTELKKIITNKIDVYKKYFIKKEFDGSSPLSTAIDILTVFEGDKFTNEEIDVGSLLSGMQDISCSDYTALGNRFWNNDSIKWSNFENCFTSCSLDLDQIPVEWGGNKSGVTLPKYYKDELLSKLDEMDTTEVISTLLKLI